MNKALKIAVILSAVDNMSATVKTAFGNLQSELLKGGALVAGGIGLGQSLVDFTESFQNMEDAAAKAKISMMGPGAVLDPAVLSEVTNFAAHLSEEYGNTTANYLDMVRVMRNNRLTESDIMGGAGKAAAMFGELFNILPKESALFAARMKNDMRVAVADMPLMLDLAARLHNAGVGTTGSETIQELTEFYGKAGLGATNLGVSGLEDTKKLGALGGIFMAKGLSGQTVGTNFRRIFDGLRDAERMGKVTNASLASGVKLEFFKDGKFAGIENFTNQLAKLQGLDPQKVDAILKPFSGKQGLSTDFLDYLVKFGSTDLAEFNERLDDQANLQEKVTVSLDTLSMHILRAQRTWENARAAIVASGFGEAIKDVFKLSKSVANATIEFAKSHPTIARWTLYAVGLTSALIFLIGIFKAVAATLAFLSLPGLFGAIGFAVWALKYHIVTGLIPALEAMGIASYSALGPIGLLLLTMVALNKAVAEYKFEGDTSPMAVGSLAARTGMYFGKKSAEEKSLNKPTRHSRTSNDIKTYTYSPTITLDSVKGKNFQEFQNVLERDFERWKKHHEEWEAEGKRRTFMRGVGGSY